MAQHSPALARAKNGPLVRAIFIAGGALLVILAHAGLIPMAWPARLLSDDGVLTPEFLGLLASSQLRLGWILIAVGIAAPLLLRACNYFLNALSTLPTWLITIACSSAGAVLTLAINRFVYDGLPHVTDEISHLFQAKILMAGRWAAPAPPCPMSFYQPHIVISEAGFWHTIYPPGHPTLLAFFGKIGLLSYAGPICTALSIFAFHRLALRFWSPRLAHITTMLFTSSPQILLLGASWMSHISFMALHASGWNTWLWAKDHRGFKRLVGICGAGFLLAWSAVVRPQDFFLSMIFAGLIFFTNSALLKAFISHIPLLLAGIIPVALYTAAWNSALYGKPWAMGYGHSPSITPQTQPTYGFHDSFGFQDALEISLWSILRLNKSLLGWPSAIPILAGLVFLRKDLNRADFGCLMGTAIIIAFYFFYFYYGAEYEARFYSLAVPLLIVLIIRSLQGWERFLPRPIVILFTAASILYSPLYYWVKYLLPRYSGDYEQVSRVIEDTARRANIQNALVLISSEPDSLFRYSAGFLWNDPFLTRDIIYAREREEDLECIRKAFQCRNLYRFIPEAGWRSGRLEPVL